jgi:polysaccharide pyruvyl transferase WcaK-like protein
LPSAKPPKILITGWYGTETAGDKAILGQLIHDIRANDPEVMIVLASLHPYVTRQTLQELGDSEVQIVPTYSRAYLAHAQSATEVVMGGGPLMHVEPLGAVLWAFWLAKCAGNRTRIAGCGIGPLDRAPKYARAVEHLLRLADTIHLRDSQSVELAKRMTVRGDIQISGDPAIGYVQRWKSKQPPSAAEPVLNLYLREWTTEYQGRLSRDEFEATREAFERELGRRIHEVCIALQLRPRLLPMHHFCVGNDDRDFNRRFARDHLRDLDPLVEHRPLSVDAILRTIQEGRLAICMRFHSVVFAHTLGVPFVAIDYTNQGKIASYVRDHAVQARMVTLPDVAAGRWLATGLPGTAR